MISGFWRGCSWIVDFTYHDAVLFRKLTHNLFNHILRKWNQFVSLGAIKYFSPISVSWILVRISRILLIHLTRRSFVCKSFSDFVLPHVIEAKKLCFNWIQVLFCSEQCFLDFGKDIREHLIWLIWTQFCSYQLLILCFTTYLGGENTKGAINYFAPINVFRVLVWIFLNTWFNLFKRSYVCKSCSDIVWPLNVEAKTLCFVGIQYLLSSD